MLEPRACFGYAGGLLLCTNGKRYICILSSGNYNHFYMFMTKFDQVSESMIWMGKKSKLPMKRMKM